MESMQGGITMYVKEIVLFFLYKMTDPCNI